jgi:dual specificity MAP kinase phosphatase
VKAGGDLSHSKVKGAIAPEEILRPLQAARDKRCDEWEFLDIDPRDGFSVRNFQIQACKMATVSDIVVYRDQETSYDEAIDLARRIARAQGAWQKRMEGSGAGSRLFNTFVVTGKLRNMFHLSGLGADPTQMNT